MGHFSQSIQLITIHKRLLREKHVLGARIGLIMLNTPYHHHQRQNSVQCIFLEKAVSGKDAHCTGKKKVWI